MTPRDETVPIWTRAARAAAKAPVYAWRYGVSPFVPPSCRYEPTCSRYALQAIDKHGALKGGYLAARRVLRCHPIEALGGGAGYDPVPEKTPRAPSRAR